MQEQQHDEVLSRAAEPPNSRRRFLLEIGSLTALATSATAAIAAPTVAHDDRASDALALRTRAAEEEYRVAAVVARTNGDEARYPNFIGNFSKGLPHNGVGEVSPVAYLGLLAAIFAGNAAGFEDILLGGNQKLVNPLAGVAFDLEGIDIQKLATPPPAPLDSAARAAEMVELYWMALARDVPFEDYPNQSIIAQACAELSSLHAFAGPSFNGQVTPASLFRGFTAGDAVGPYVSQLFLTPFAYGQYHLDGRITTYVSGIDYMSTQSAWLAVQNGQGSGNLPFGGNQADPVPRYFRNGRDLAAYVHSDQVCQAFYNAGLRLYALNAAANPGNPYLRLSKQAPFATFGAPHFLTLQAEAALRAMKAVFYQKWFVHRLLRPEAYAGLVHMEFTRQANYPLHRSVLESAAVAAIAQRWQSWFLPQVFPEGSPQHPSYTQAHGGVAGACATILKAAFDGQQPWAALPAPLQVAAVTAWD
ncbi:MAG TPA: hypothetical protein VN709_11485 [Terriglobales bacterium]|nr:hypothetical protein [Terriglobales bacterium]